jgi:hypothetical protein
MTPVWNAWGLFGLAALVVCAAMGAFVFATRPNRAQNRRLGVLLVMEGIITAASPAGAAFAGSDAMARAFFTVHFVALAFVLPLMLRFLATIETPLARPLATRPGAVLPWFVAAAEGTLVVTRPALFFRDFIVPWWGGRMFEDGPLTHPAYALSGVALTYSLIVAISAYRRAPAGAAAKERARRYAIAFGFNDALILLVSVVVPSVYGASHGGDLRRIAFIFVWAIPIVEIVFVGLMAHGILRTQLFDIDVRLAAGLRRSTLAAILLFTFFTAAEIAKTIMSQDFGYVIGAVATAAIIVFVHKPMERFAEGFSSAVLPAGNASPEYLAFRKLEVYLEAVEAALEDGRVSKDDRVILSRLQAKLGVSSADAARLEDDTAKRLSAGRAVNRRKAQKAAGPS